MERDLTYAERMAYGRHSHENTEWLNRVYWSPRDQEFRIVIDVIESRPLAEHRAPMAPDVPVLADDFYTGATVLLDDFAGMAPAPWWDPLPPRQVGLWTGPW